MRRPLRVGRHVVRPDAREVVAPEGEVRRVGPKASQVLDLLIAARGAVVPKEALIEAVWEETWVSDEALTSVIYELRRAFDDDARTSGVIETIRKTGFRLVVPVVPLETEAASGRASPEIGESPGALRRSRLVVLLPALLLVALLALVVSRESRDGGVDGAVGPPPIRAVAVLPSGLVRPADEEALVGALTEMLTTELAQVCSAEVVPGIVVRDREGPWDLEDSRRELGVDAVVEGSILRSGDRLWISVQLVDSRSGRLLWAGSWDRSGREEGAVLREVALEAAVAVDRAIPAP